MTITVDSSQWTGEPGGAESLVPVVWGEFADEAARLVAVQRLRAAGAQEEHPGSAAAEGSQALAPPDDHPQEADLRNLRQLGVGIAMAAGSMAAAGLVIASGGALLPAVAAAALAGTALGAAGEAVATVAAPVRPDETSRTPLSPENTPQGAAAHGPLIGLRAPNGGMRERAEALLRDAGARRIFVQDAGAR